MASSIGADTEGLGFSADETDLPFQSGDFTVEYTLETRDLKPPPRAFL